MVKEQYRDPDVVRRISHVCFGIQSPDQMEKCSQLQVVAKNLYNQDSGRTAVPFGVLDSRMGTSQKDSKCTTCGKGLADCIGHFGYVDLGLPVFHVGYFRSIIQVLQCVCKTCCRVLLRPPVAKSFREKLKKLDLPYLSKKNMRKKIIEVCKKLTVSQHFMFNISVAR